MPALTLQTQYKRRSTQLCRPKRYVYFRPSATWYNQGHGSSSSLASKQMIFGPPHPHLPAPAGSAVGLHDCLYCGAKIGILQLLKQLAIELNIWRCFNCSATTARRYQPRTRSLSPTGPQWRTTTDSVLCGFLAVLLSASFESWHTRRRSPPA